MLLYLQGFRPQAMAVTCDPEHKFELALQLGDLKIAYQLAKEAEVIPPHFLLHCMVPMPAGKSLNVLDFFPGFYCVGGFVAGPCTVREYWL